MSTADNTRAVSLSFRPRPFSTARVDRALPAGDTLHGLLAAAGLDAGLLRAHDAHVFVNDLLVPRSAWGELVPVAGDIVSVSVVPSGGGGGGKDPMRTVGMIAIMVIAIVATYGVSALAAPAYGTAAAGALGAAAGAAVTIGGSMLLNALVPIQTPEAESGGRPRYTISSTRNALDPYGPVTRIFGKTRTFPKFAAVPYTELQGPDQYLRCLFLIGEGRYRLSEHKIGDTALDDYAGVEIEEYYSGDATNNRFNLFPTDVAEQSLSVALTKAGGWQTRTTAADIDEFSLDITCPGGIYHTRTDGGYGGMGVAIEAEYAAAGTTDWKSLTYTAEMDLVRHYPAHSEPSPAIAAGMSVLGQTSGATGTVQLAQQILEYYELPDGSSVPAPITRRIRVEVTSGEFVKGETLTIAGGAYAAKIDKIPRLGLLLYGSSPTLTRFGWAVSVPRGQYDVRVRRITNDGRDDTTDLTYWTALRSVTHEAPVNLAGVTLVGMRIKATGQLNGGLDAYNCIAEAILPAHDGSTWADRITRSPAWAYAEVLRGSANKRAVSDARIDIAGLRTWAANCAAAGRECNGEITGRSTVIEVLRDVAVCGRATPSMTDNKFGVVEDKVRTVPVQHFSPRNSWGFSGRRVFPDLPHAFRIRFRNAAAGWVDDECVVYDDGYSAVNATRFETIETRLITSYDEVWKLGRYWIAVARLRPEVFEFNVDAEHLVCTRGDLIRLSHDALLVGLGAGRVKTITAASATFDDVFAMEAGKSYGVRFRKSDGSTQLAPVATVVGDNYGVTFTPELTALPAVGDLALFGEYGTESLECIVTRIEPGADLAAKISCVAYAPAVLTADAGEIPAHDPGITLPAIVDRKPPAPVIESTHYGYKATARRDDGTYAIELAVVFSAAGSGFSVGANERDAIAGFQAQYRDTENEGWRELPRMGPDARSFSFVAQNGQTYDVRVRALSPLPGLSSDWDTETGIVINIAGSVPANVTGLQVKGGGTSFASIDCEIEWTAVTGGGTAGLLVQDYQVETRTSDGLTVLRTEYVTGAGYVYTFEKNLADGGPRATVKFYVKARSVWGDLSATAAMLTVTNPAPANPTSLATQAYMGGVAFSWAANAEPDFSHFLVRTKVTSGGTFGSWTKVAGQNFNRGLTPAEKTSHGGSAAIYLEVKAVDWFGQESGASAANLAAGSINVQETDIADFAIKASKLFTRIPVIENLTLTNNSPAAGRIAWSACSLYYNGVKYEIPAGNTSVSTHVYVYWKDLASSFTTRIDHPADNLSDWTPGEDFIIATNKAGVAQAAWNANANQVVGSSYIMNLGVQDAHIANISGTKILATTSVAIGPASAFGTDGIQLEYNSGNPRFYAGNGAGKHIKFDGTDVEIAGKVSIVTGSSGYGNLSDRPAAADINNSYAPRPANICPQSGFDQGWIGWTRDYYGITSTDGFNASPYYTIKGRITPYIHQTGSGENQDYYIGYESPRIPVVPGQRYCHATYTGAQACRVTAQAVYYNSGDAVIGTSAGASNINELGGGQTLDTFKRVFEFFTPPAGTAYIRLSLRKYDTYSGQPNSYAFFGPAMVAEAGADQTAAPPWAPYGTDFSAWAAVADITKIDGGNIYASSSVAIGGTTFGTDGIQLQYNSGNPRFYCGDGSNNYLQFNGSNVKISSSLADALVIKGGGNIKVEAGGDIVLFGDRTDPGTIIFSGGVTKPGVELGLWVIAGLPDTYFMSFGPITSGSMPLFISGWSSVNVGPSLEVEPGDIKIVTAGKGIILTNAAGTVTRRCRLNDAGNGWVFGAV